MSQRSIHHASSWSTPTSLTRPHSTRRLGSSTGRAGRVRDRDGLRPGGRRHRPAAVARIFAAKGRPAINPVIVHVADLAQARSVRHRLARRLPQHLAARFWPGPLTLVLHRVRRHPRHGHRREITVGVRLPARKVARGLIERTRPSRSPPPVPTGPTGSHRPGPSTCSPISTAGST